MEIQETNMQLLLISEKIKASQSLLARDLGLPPAGLMGLSCMSGNSCTLQ